MFKVINCFKFYCFGPKVMNYTVIVYMVRKLVLLGGGHIGFFVTGWWKLPSIFQSYELGYTYVNLCRYVANIIFFGGIVYFVVIVIKTIIVLHLILRGSKAGSSTLTDKTI